MKTVAPEDTVFSPQEVGVRAYQVIEERQKNPRVGVLTTISSVDCILNPHRPGELRVVLGYTSNYKSGFMNYVSRQAARAIKARDETETRCVISITWEQSIEEQGVTDLAQLGAIDITRLVRGEITQDEWTKLQKACIERGGLPWWMIGHSSEGHARRPRLSMGNVWQAIEMIIDGQGKIPELVVLDYLQRIRRENDGETRIQFMDIVDQCKDLALDFHVPVLLGSQASRRVKEREWRLPQSDDGQETSNLEQSADSLLSLWMPKQDYPEGHQIAWGDVSLTVHHNLLILGILKQKFGDAPRNIPLFVQPEINEIKAMDIHRVELNQRDS